MHGTEASELIKSNHIIQSQHYNWEDWSFLNLHGWYRQWQSRNLPNQSSSRFILVFEATPYFFFSVCLHSRWPWQKSMSLQYSNWLRGELPIPHCITELIWVRPHELCESIKDFLISAFISYMIDPISGACFVRDMVAITTAYRTTSVLNVWRECGE